MQPIHTAMDMLSILPQETPSRRSNFLTIKTEVAPDTPGFCTSCSTRWTVIASSLQSVLDNYTVLQELWEEAVEIVSDSEARARIVGVSAGMATFDYLFGIVDNIYSSILIILAKHCRLIC